MAAFPAGNGRTRLVRNHEMGLATRSARRFRIPRPHGYIFEVPTDGLGDPTPFAPWDASRTRRSPSIRPLVTSTRPRTPAAARDCTASFPRSLGSFAPAVVSSCSKGEARIWSTLARAAPQEPRSMSNGCRSAFPTTPHRARRATSFGRRGAGKGAATFARLEGCWYGNDARIYIVSTSGGIGQGQIWVY